MRNGPGGPIADAVVAEDQTAVIQFLSRPETYGADIDAVERIETHASIVFLAGPRAYKLKRAVVFPYLDYSTAERRRFFCEREVEINCRTAPALYLGVIAVTRTATGGLSLGGDGAALDWLVVMQRFDGEALFDRMATRGALTRPVIDDLAEAIARFHREAEVRPNAGGSAAVAACIASNERAFALVTPALLDPERVSTLLAAQRSAVAAVARSLDDRQAGGFVRHCHGDLHLRNVVLWEGRPTLFDAIEFNDSFADIDVLYDVAFLIMDLAFRDLPFFASVAMNRYLDATGDTATLQVLPLFLSMRASIRSHVDAMAALRHSEPAAATPLREKAIRYLELAQAYLVPPTPRLVAIGGLSGSGKSRLARSLAPEMGGVPGARVVRTDTTRKRLARVGFQDRLPALAYTEEANRRTYAAVFAEAEGCLAAGWPVIVDGVFARPEEREAAEALAARAKVPFVGLWLEAAVDQLEARIANRQDRVSDATADVLHRQLTYDIGAVTWHRLSSSGAPEATLAAARAIVGKI